MTQMDKDIKALEQASEQTDSSKEATPSSSEATTESPDSQDPAASATDTQASVKDESAGSVVAEKSKEDLVPKRKDLATRISHLKLLINFMETELGSYLEVQKRVKDGTLEKISFEDLFYLFHPGETVYFKSQGHEQLGTAYAVTGGRQRKKASLKEANNNQVYNPMGKYDADIMSKAGYGTWSPLTVDTFTMEYDGYFVGPMDGREQIKHYVGLRDITDLNIYPLRFHKNKEQVLARLIARGKKYISSHGHQSYNGMTCPVNNQESPEEFRGDIFVDVRDYYRDESRPKPQLGVLQRTTSDEAETEEFASGRWWYFCDAEVDQRAAEDFMLTVQHKLEPLEFGQYEPTEENLQLFPHRVPAFVFRTREYGKLSRNHDLFCRLQT